MSDDESSELDDTPASPLRRNFMQGSIAGAVLGASGLGSQSGAKAQPTKTTVSHR